MPKLAIKEMLKRRRVSLYRLGLLLDMDPKNVARLTRPGYNPKFDMLVRIAKALKCKVRDLIRE
jgi:DNA-binding Xre family transcriptional regulator